MPFPEDNVLKPSDLGSTVQPYDVDTPIVTASQVEMEAGTEVAVRAMSPLGIFQAIAAKATALGVELTSRKDISGGYAGLTLFKINFRNAANTFTSFLTNSNTAARTYTFPDKDMTVASLDTNTFTGAQILGDQEFSRGMLKDTGMVVVDKGNSGTATQTLDYTAGHIQKITATGDFTLAFSNWPAAGNKGVMELWAVNFGAYNQTWPTIDWIKPDGTTTPSATTWLASWTGRTLLQSSGIDRLKFYTIDGGTTVYGEWA